MDLGLAGQVVAVFGAARGIGEAIARAFMAEGTNVATIDRDSSVMDVAEQLPLVASTTAGVFPAAGRPPVARPGGRRDRLRRRSSVGRGGSVVLRPLRPRRLRRGGRVRQVRLPVLEPGAGRLGTGVAGQSDRGCTRGPRLCTHAGTGRSRYAAVHLVSSRPDRLAVDPPYSAAKAGLINFAQCAAKDLAPHGVRVNALCPGMVKTPLNRSVWAAWNERQPLDQRQSYEDWTAEKIKKLVPLNRWQEPEDIAAMSVFLASRQGQNIAGQTINVDGGYVMHW